MTRSLLADAYDHHVWATLRLIDACAELTADQLATSVPGTYGSILDTLRHLVGSDSWYLHRLTDGSYASIPDEEEERMDIPGLRAAMQRHGVAWSDLLAGDLDPERIIVTRRDDGSETRVPAGIRIAQVLHHGTDHRSQVCTALTALGIEPPEIDAWDYALAKGLMVEVEPGS